MLISVVNQYASLAHDRLFSEQVKIEGPHAGNEHWFKPYWRLANEGKKLGFQFHTADVIPPETADVVIFMDLCWPRKKVLDLLERTNRPWVVLMMVESPLFNFHAFGPLNYGIFDRVLTFKTDLVDHRRVFHYRLPVGQVDFERQTLPFEQRKVSVMINANQRFSLRSRLRVLKNAAREGWRPSLQTIWTLMTSSGELYSARKELVRNLFNTQPGSVEVFGRGWDQYPYGKGLVIRNKIELMGNYRFNICYENVEQSPGYVSEKLWDAFASGTVPVYRGDSEVAKRLPRDAFVWAGDFDGERELARFLVNCGPKEWNRFHEVGKKYQDWEYYREFGEEAFVDNVFAVLKGLNEE